MKCFYKIVNNTAHIGSGNAIPIGFIEFTKGEEPTELLKLLNIEEQENLKIAINQASIQYLNDTDWLLLRELDGGPVMDTSIKLLRAEARAKVIR